MSLCPIYTLLTFVNFQKTFKFSLSSSSRYLLNLYLFLTGMLCVLSDNFMNRSVLQALDALITISGIHSKTFAVICWVFFLCVNTFGNLFYQVSLLLQLLFLLHLLSSNIFDIFCVIPSVFFLSQSFQDLFFIFFYNSPSYSFFSSLRSPFLTFVFYSASYIFFALIFKILSV